MFPYPFQQSKESDADVSVAAEVVEFFHPSLTGHLPPVIEGILGLLVGAFTGIFDEVSVG